MHTVKEKQTLQTLILDAARELFVEEGYKNVTMRKIARKIGYSATTIYLYFKNKTELFNCLAEEMLERLLKVFKDVQGENLEPVAQLKKMGEAYVQLALVLTFGFTIFTFTQANLRRQAIATGFDFISREAGFEIGESLIPYSAADTYARAILVGILNTLKVAVIGMVLTVLLGTCVGVARLSSNWLLSRLAAAYIEVLQSPLGNDHQRVEILAFT